MTSLSLHPPSHHGRHGLRRLVDATVRRLPVLCLAVALTACGTAPPRPASPFPPSASDLDLLGATRLCDSKDDIVRRWRDTPYRATPWGAGEQLQRATAPSPSPSPPPSPPPSSPSPSGHDGFYFFDDERILVGAVFRFSRGLNLAPYPVLRETLAALVPSSTFYLDPTQLLSGDGARAQSAVLYRTGDRSTTTQYLVLERGENPLLLAASMVIDPYEQLLSGYHEKFLPALKRRSRAETAGASTGGDTGGDFLGTQQFARGEAALFGSCGPAQPDIAADAYRRSIRHGLNDKTRFAEAHHRLGLALRDQGRLADAQQTLEQAMSLRPHAPEIINSLGRVLAEQRQWARARPLFERAIVLRPNFADARFNLGESLEPLNPRRAIEEYETYLALADGIPGEARRVMMVKERVKRLKSK